MKGELYNDRDLSWLSFNRRVLEETEHEDLKPYDRVKFIAIHGSNLDEFARVRLSALEHLALNGSEQNRKYYLDILDRARGEVYNQSIASREVLENTIIPELESHGVVLYYGENSLTGIHYEEVMNIFMSQVLSYLQPVIITSKKGIFLEDRSLYFLVHLNAGRRLENLKIVLNIPNNLLPRFFQLSSVDGKHHIIYLDDVIRIGAKALFRDFTFLGFYSIKLNRDADLHMTEEVEEQADFLEGLQRGLNIRRTGDPSRFQYDPEMPEPLVEFCKKQFKLDEGEMLPVGRYLSTADYFRFPNPVGSSLLQATLTPLKHRTLTLYGNYFKAITAQDYLLHFPYQSYDYVLVFFNLAVLDQNVTEIMATFYRVAQDSHIVNALISAAKNGKKVKAFVELTARFDEANNIHWAEQMAKAGVEITYSIPGIKVHAKVALIKRRESGKERKYAFLGTGNFNEKTAGIYSDMGLFTSKKELCDELEVVFQYLYERKEPKPFQYLLVSQFGSLEKFLWLIDREIECARSGKPCGITIKINNLEDEEMIDKLYEASQAGVPIKLMVRSICCIKAGVPGLSENIRLYRVVGRYLEHSRIFLFYNNGNHDLYMGSADWMSRNLRHRVEVIFPILDAYIKREVMEFLEIQFMPAVKTQWLSEKLETIEWPEPPKQYSAQQSFYSLLKENLFEIENHHLSAISLF
jgi:polyphosphate kinase